MPFLMIKQKCTSLLLQLQQNKNSVIDKISVTLFFSAPYSDVFCKKINILQY